MAESNAAVVKPLYTWRSAICESKLPATTRHVALTLSLHMSERGDSCFPGACLLARETGLSERRVRDHLSVLVDGGWLRLVERGGLRGHRRHANVYVAANPGHTVTHDAESPMTESAATPDGNDTPPLTESHASIPLRTPKRAPTSLPKRASTVPVDFVADEAMRAWAVENTPRVDLDRETAQWRDYHTAKGDIAKDWRASWRTWMRNARDWNRPAARAGPRSQQLDTDRANPETKLAL